MPVDAEPVENGNIQLTEFGDGVRVVAPGDGTHVAHFTTCPKWPKRRPAFTPGRPR